MKTEARMEREKAKELLGLIDSTIASSSKGSEVRQKVVKLLNTFPTYNWVGIYLVKGNNLHLDAWSGPAPTVHIDIPIGKGICGWAAKSGRTEIVSDVSKDSRYLQCFMNTKAEIVAPILREGKVVGEIDIDGDRLNAFSSMDREFLEAVAAKISASCLS